MTAEDWKKYQDKLNEKIDNILAQRGWGVTIPKTKENLLPLFKHLTVVVNTFLESDIEDKLFIKVPVEELALEGEKDKDDGNQTEAYNLFIGVILGCLATATSKEFQAKLRPKFESYTDVQGYKEGDFFCCAARELGDPIYSYIRVKGDRLQLRFHGYTSPRKTFDQLCDKDSFIYINIKDIPFQKKATFDRISEAAGLVDKLPSLDKSYDSATLVTSHNPQNDCLPSLDTRLHLPYKHMNAYLPSEVSREILVFVGDKAYQHNIQSAYNGNIRKCIFIGSEFPNDGTKPKCYELSHRELYGSIAPKVSFHNPIIVELDFPWLQDARKKLEDLLAKYNDLDSKTKVRIIHYALAPMCDPSFNQELLLRMQEKSVWAWLYDRVGGEPDEDLVDDIEAWLEALSFDKQVNPKQSWCSKYLKKDDTYVPSGWSVPKRKIKKVCGHSKAFVVGLHLGFGKDIASSPLEYILRHQIAPKISVLFYKGIEDLRRRTLETYIANEERVYTSELRAKWTLSWQDVFPESSSVKVFAEPDDLPELQDIWYKSNSTASEAQKFEVTCTSGKPVSLQGEILLWDEDDELWERCSLSDLLQESKSSEDLPQERIRYYQQPQCFVTLTEDKEVEKYSKKWQEAFRNEYSARLSSVAGAKDEDVLEELKNDLGLKNSSLKAYIEGNSSSKFLKSEKDMLAMCDWLKSVGRISDSDVRAILQARRAYNSGTIVGKNLKSDLFEYIQAEKTSERLSLRLEDKGISIDSLIDEAIVEVEITNIKKKI